MKQHRYSFTSTWQIPASRVVVWEALTAVPFSWPQWWSQLRDLQIDELHPSYIGTRFSCVWRAPLGYRLRTHFVAENGRPEQTIRCRSTGDLEGITIWKLRSHAGGTQIAISWQVVTTRWWMNAFAPLLKPIFIRSHHHIMQSGERGLSAYISTLKNPAS